MCGTAMRLFLSVSLMLIVECAVVLAQNRDPLLNRSRIEFLKRDRDSTKLLIGEFRATLDYLGNEDQNVSKYLKKIAIEKSRIANKRIEKMPVWILDDSEIAEFAANVSKSTGSDFRKVKKRIEQKFYDHYKKKDPNAIQNLKEQWEFINQAIDEIEKETGESEIVKQLFYWRIIRNGGLARFLPLPMVSKATGITEDEIKAVKSSAASQAIINLKLRIENCRRIYAAILSELTGKQRRTFSRRMGIRWEILPQVFDQSIGARYHFHSRHHKLKFCEKPYEYFQEINYGPHRTKGISPSDKLLKSISNWKYSSQNRLRHHAVEVKSPTNEVPMAVKSEFQGGYKTNFVDTGAYMLPPRLFWRMKRANGEFKESYSMFSPKKGDLKTAYRDWTNEQIKKFNEASYRASLATVKASSTDEICQIYSDWVEEVGKILLPEQAVFIYQRTVARNGLVSFLTRPDVATEMRISDSQKDKIVEVASYEAKTITPLTKKLTQQYYNAIVKSIPAQKRQRLAKLLGIQENNLANQLMAVGSSIGHFRDVPWPALYWPRKDMFNGNNSNVGGLDGLFAHKERYEKACKILSIPLKIAYPNYVK